MQSGIVFGYIGLIEGVVARMRQELGGQLVAYGHPPMEGIEAEQPHIQPQPGEKVAGEADAHRVQAQPPSHVDPQDGEGDGQAPSPGDHLG